MKVNVRMQGFSPRDFAKLIISQGWQYSHTKGTHQTYCKSGISYHVTIPFHEKELSRPMTKRLLKEAMIAT